MITLLTGAPGHGKSYTMVREIEQSVAKGTPVATNVPLREDWPTVMARRHTLFGRWRQEAVERKAAQFEKLVIVSDDFDVLLRIRLAGEGEERGLLALDEAHRWINTRGLEKEEHDDGKPMTPLQIRQRRKVIVNHLSGHRHYGWKVILGTQSDKSLDTQARDLYEFHSEVRNMRRLPWLGVFMRFNLFLRVTRWNDRARSKAGVECYWLSKSLARLYSTHSLESKDWPDDAIILPLENKTDPPDEPEFMGIPVGLGLEGEPVRPPLPDPADIRSSYAR